MSVGGDAAPSGKALLQLLCVASELTSEPHEKKQSGSLASFFIFYFFFKHSFLLLRDVLKQEGKLRLPRRQLSSDAAFTVTARNQRGAAAHAAALAPLAAAVITAHFLFTA